MLQYWTTVGIAVVGFSISIVSIVTQMKRSRFQQSIDLLFRVEGDFFGHKQALRARAATEIGLGNYAEVEPILDFFETVALLTDRGALDEYMVWHTFFYWINNYYEIAKPQIALKQAEDPAIWADLGKLVGKLRERQRASRSLNSAAAAAPSADEMAAFLLEESAEALN
jgi:hypothetical protein